MGIVHVLNNSSLNSGSARPAQRPAPELIEEQKVKDAMGQLHSHPDIDRLLGLMWRKDPDTYRHCHRVADWSQWVGGTLGLNAQERVELYLCGLLHDIGKLMTPVEVLRKPGALTNAEFAIMKMHSADSGKVVRRLDDLSYLEAPIRGHHERIDGRGYPDGLRADQIHVFSRVILIADTFDAMTSDRVYRKGLSSEQAYEELLRFSGTQFDPDAARAFIKAHQQLQIDRPDSHKVVVESKHALRKAA
jgi:HD-GYP domain-containing protein (c-di-GMP phosphodiesterase class II)